jgi:hypothetical protein
MLMMVLIENKGNQVVTKATSLNAIGKLTYNRKPLWNIFIPMIRVHGIKGKMAIAPTLATNFLPGSVVQKVKAELTF